MSKSAPPGEREWDATFYNSISTLTDLPFELDYYHFNLKALKT